MLAAPIIPERLDEHFRAGRVLLDGEPVESLDAGVARDSDSLRARLTCRRSGSTSGLLAARAIND
jgi:hypothetical protein